MNRHWLSIVAAALPLSMMPQDLKIPVVDLHVDLPWQVHFKNRDIALKEGQVTLQSLSSGHYKGIVFPIYMPDKIRPTGPNIDDATNILNTIENIATTHRTVFLPIGSNMAEPGRISTFVSIEGAGAFADQIEQIDLFIHRGVRLIGPVHAHNNRLASSATDTKATHGLTELGKKFCERVYSKGALIDVSHMSDSAFDDLVYIAERFHAPIVASHSNARAIMNVDRNLTDTQMKTIAATNGTIGLNFYARFVSSSPNATLDDLVTMALHMIQVAGIDHVSIGSDFDGGITPVSGLENASRLPQLVQKLAQRGLTESDLLKVFSLNALRVLGWRPAPMQQP